MSEEISAEVTQEANTPDTSAADAVAGMVGDESNDFGFVLDKYKAEGRSDQDAAYEQAKAYTELQKQFGSFTGAPESYEMALSEELQQMGVEFDPEDPLIESAMEFAKKSNMSQEGFTDMLNLYAEIQAANGEATKQHVQAEMEALGPNAQARVQNVNSWIQANMDAQTAEGLQEAAVSASAFQAIEQLISMTRGASISPESAAPAPSINGEQVRAMQFELDEHGNRRINTDPDFKARYLALRDQAFGTEEHRVMIGG